MSFIKSRVFLILAGILTSIGVIASTAQASCVPMTAAEQRARADVIFNGVALQGPTSTGIQRFRVTRYLKGSGPRIVRVNTGNIRRPDGSGTTTSVSLVVRRGERWRIYGRGSARRVVRSNLCDGSRRL
jgi:hypothetical protein